MKLFDNPLSALLAENDAAFVTCATSHVVDATIVADAEGAAAKLARTAAIAPPLVDASELRVQRYSDAVGLMLAYQGDERLFSHHATPNPPRGLTGEARGGYLHLLMDVVAGMDEAGAQAIAQRAIGSAGAELKAIAEQVATYNATLAQRILARLQVRRAELIRRKRDCIARELAKLDQQREGLLAEQAKLEADGKPDAGKARRRDKMSA